MQTPGKDKQGGTLADGPSVIIEDNSSKSSLNTQALDLKAIYDKNKSKENLLGIQFFVANPYISRLKWFSW